MNNFGHNESAVRLAALAGDAVIYDTPWSLPLSCGAVTVGAAIITL